MDFRSCLYESSNFTQFLSLPHDQIEVPIGWNLICQIIKNYISGGLVDIRHINPLSAKKSLSPKWKW